MREAGARCARIFPLMLALGLGVSGCSTDTAGLARREPGAAQGGTSNGPEPSPGGAGGDPEPTGAEGGAPATGGNSGIGTISVVHGVIDGGRLLACFLDAGSGQPIDGAVSDPSSGIAYGQSITVPTSWDVSSADVLVDLFVAAGASAPGCSELRDTATDSSVALPRSSDAGAPDAGLVAFPVQPDVPRRAGSVRLAPGVLRAGAHYVLVSAGCTGPGGGSSEDLCGPLDSLFESQQALVLAELSDDRSGQDGLGLQFLNASRAVSRADLVLQGDNDRESLSLSSDVQFGAVRPESSVLVAEPVGLELHVEAATRSSFTQPWSDTVASADLVPGNYLVVYVGPEPGAFLPEGVAPPRFVLVLGRPAQPPG